MANSQILAPFIFESEGGYVNDPLDRGGETNKGITWKNWISIFGDTDASHNRFMVMDNDDWNTVFKKYFWDIAQGDKINSQRIANMLIDWLWTSWVVAIKSIQKILNLTQDGIVGQQTITSINTSPETELYENLISARNNFYGNVVKEDATQQEFLAGWLNRVKNLDAYNNKLS